MGKPARKTAFPFTPKRGHFNTATYSFYAKNIENSKYFKLNLFLKNFLLFLLFWTVILFYLDFSKLWFRKVEFRLIFKKSKKIFPENKRHNRGYTLLRSSDFRSSKYPVGKLSTKRGTVLRKLTARLNLFYDYAGISQKLNTGVISVHLVIINMRYTALLNK